MPDQTYPPEEAKRMVEKGLYTSSNESSFKSERTIKREAALRGDLPVFETPPLTPPDLNTYLSKAEERKKSTSEFSPLSENQVTIRLPFKSAIHFGGDWHFGHPNTDNLRISQEIEAIKQSPGHYLALIGDIVNGVWWGGVGTSEQNFTLTEQYGFLRTLFKELKGKILMGVSGEHDSKWASKTGADPYFIMTEESGAPYIRGVAEVKVLVGEQEYKLVVSHKAQGHSMYNKNHPTFREARFGLQGADAYISAHTHQKQISQEAIRSFGESRLVTHISIGPYKSGDEYGDREGFVRQNKEEMYGASLLLHETKRKIEVCGDILEAIEKWQ